MKNIFVLIIITLVFLSACSSTENKRATLRDIDIVSEKQAQQKVFIKPKSKVDIRKAYSDYLKFASKDDNSRLDAINRLAELEFELSSKLQQETENLKQDNNEDIDDKLYNERLIKLLNY